jgi:hypothetical protein
MIENQGQANVRRTDAGGRGEAVVRRKAARSTRFAAGVALASALAAVAHAQPASDASLEVTIRLLPENAVGPQEITRRIELPPAAVTEAPQDRADGSRPDPERDRADGREPGPRVEPEAGGGEAREQARGQGRDVATDARERGREAGREAADQARENRENAGRPDDAGPRGRPDDAGPPRDPPGRPDDAGPPGGPPGNP